MQHPNHQTLMHAFTTKSVGRRAWWGGLQPTIHVPACTEHTENIMKHWIKWFDLKGRTRHGMGAEEKRCLTPKQLLAGCCPSASEFNGLKIYTIYKNLTIHIKPNDLSIITRFSKKYIKQGGGTFFPYEWGSRYVYIIIQSYVHIYILYMTCIGI